MCGPASGADGPWPCRRLYRRDGARGSQNAVYYNKISGYRARARAFIQSVGRISISISIKLASRLIVDAIIPPSQLREELINRFAVYASKHVTNPRKRHGVMPV
jgi:acetyl-CoA carboxylase carboxyltransferase component